MSDQPPSANTNKGSSLPDDASREAVKRMSVRGPSGTNFETLCDAWWLGRQSATDRRGHDAIRNVSGTDLQWRCNRDITELIKESVVAQPPSDPARDRLARMQGQSMRPDIDALAASVGSVGTDRRPKCKSLRDCSGPNCDCGQPAPQGQENEPSEGPEDLTRRVEMVEVVDTVTGERTFRQSGPTVRIRCAGMCQEHEETCERPCNRDDKHEGRCACKDHL
jgi:hypothetical protein